MTREEAIKRLHKYAKYAYDIWNDGNADAEAFNMAIEALQFAEHFDLLKEFQSLQEVVRCKDCRHASECDKSVQYRRHELNTVTIGYSPIEWCSRGERKEP